MSRPKLALPETNVATMSASYPPPTGITLSDPSDPKYYVYGAQYPIPQAPGVPSHLDGAAFWYRRDTSDIVYRDASNLAIYGRGPVIPPLENPPNVLPAGADE